MSTLISIQTNTRFALSGSVVCSFGWRRMETFFGFRKKRVADTQGRQQSGDSGRRNRDRGQRCILPKRKEINTEWKVKRTVVNN